MTCMRVYVTRVTPGVLGQVRHTQEGREHCDGRHRDCVWHAWRRYSAPRDAPCAQRPRNGRAASAGGLRACLVVYILQDARGVRWCVPLFLCI